MYKNRSKGFTLIELLVVIAIIGILSAVVLASLNTARNKGSDAAIKSNLDTIRTQSAIYYDSNTNYGTAATAPVQSSCTTFTALTMLADTNVKAAIQAADNANGASSVVCNFTPNTTQTAWAIASPLVTSNTSYFCVDSLGTATTTATALSTNTACP